MHILYLTISQISDLQERSIDTSLIKKFCENGHDVFVLSPYERRFHQNTQLIEFNNVKFLKIKTLNLQKANFIEKGIGYILLEYQFKKALKRYLKGINFSLIIYSTPPINFTEVIKYVKKKQHAISYLLLKDIFPQNAIDLNILSINNPIYHYFKHKEKQLYQVSDFIGCMSNANCEYLHKMNPYLDTNKLEVNPNTIDLLPYKDLDLNEAIDIKKKLNIPINRMVFLYGGNLGKPQGIKFLIETLDYNLLNDKVFFIVIGSGTEYPKLEKWLSVAQPKNVLLLKRLPKTEYENIARICDVGMIFLDPRFTIPNFPSRLLSYLELKKPIIAATDLATDIGKIAAENKFGFWCKSGDINSMCENIKKFTDNKEQAEIMGLNGYNYFLNNYLSENSYSLIMNHINNE